MRGRTWSTALVIPLAAVLAACAGGEAGSADRGGSGDGAAAGAETAAAGTAAADSAAVLTDRLMAWQGGPDAWESTRFLRFTWIVEREGETAARRSHAWNRRTGDYRLSFERDDGTRVLALFEVPTMKSDTLDPAGDVWVGGEQLSGAARDSALRQAYGAFINDSYWLLMPLKWRDSGVHLEYAGPTELPNGESYPAVHLTFDQGLGVTNDQYWGFLDPSTGRMAAWRFHLQGQEEKGPVIWWRDWRTFGPQELKLALDRRWESGPVRIHFEEVAADTAVPADVFAPPGE